MDQCNENGIGKYVTVCLCVGVDFLCEALSVCLSPLCKCGKIALSNGNKLLEYQN